MKVQANGRQEWAGAMSLNRWDRMNLRYLSVMEGMERGVLGWRLIGRWWGRGPGGKVESKVYAKDDSAYLSGYLNGW